MLIGLGLGGLNQSRWKAGRKLPDWPKLVQAPAGGERSCEVATSRLCPHLKAGGGGAAGGLCHLLVWASGVLRSAGSRLEANLASPPGLGLGSALHLCLDLRHLPPSLHRPTEDGSHSQPTPVAWARGQP